MSLHANHSAIYASRPDPRVSDLSAHCSAVGSGAGSAVGSGAGSAVGPTANLVTNEAVGVTADSAAANKATSAAVDTCIQHSVVAQIPIAQIPMAQLPGHTAARLLAKEQSSVRLHSIEPLPVNLLTAGSPAVGMTLMASSFSVLLAFFWLRICRLSALIRRRDQRIKKLVALDSLTSLSNRDSLFQTGEQLLQTFPNAKIALFSINIHPFKAINDEFGYAVGDELLQQIARRLQTCIGPQDTLARVGDDQFSLLLSPHYDAPLTSTPGASCGQAKTIACQILSVLHRPFYVQSHTVCVEASLGIAIAKRPRQGFEQLVLQSMAALAQAKKTPVYPSQDASHRYAFFVPAMEVKRASNRQMRRDLSQAIAGQELRIRYQPIVSLKTQKTVGFEALVRWQHPTLGLLSPDRFLPLAEEMGLIVAIDRWVLEAACQQLMTWQAEQLYPSLSVNLSGAQLSQPDVTEHVRSLLSRYDINPSQLNLEITESMLIDEPAQAISTLHQLKQMGLRLSLDDFGTGYSSLEYLHQFPVDVLKVDKSFIGKMGSPSNPSDHQAPGQIIVQSILSLAQGLALEVVAEGIEYEEQRAQLRKMQCTYGQGNFFAEPMTSLSAGALLKHRR